MENFFHKWTEIKIRKDINEKSLKTAKCDQLFDYRPRN